MNIVPRVFIGSSKETLPIAAALQKALSEKFDVTVWDEAFFTGEILLTAIVASVAKHDFGVFLFGGEDQLKSRGQKHNVVRDNVLFELGVFMGGLGHARTFFALVQEGDRKQHIPTDLRGVLHAGTVQCNKKRAKGIKDVANTITRAAMRLGPALRNSHNEMLTLKTILDDQEIKAKGKSHVLGKLVREAAAARTRPWIPRSDPRDLMEHIRKRTNHKVTNEAYWWLVVEGVFKFDNIEYFTGDTWNWNSSVDYVCLSERGVALLNEFRSETEAQIAR